MPVPDDHADLDANSGEAALVARLRAGEAAAYERLVRDYGGPILAAARRMLRNEDDARDTVQDAFISAFRSIGRFEGQSRLSTWLHRIAINAALMKIRSRSGKRETSIDQLLPKFLEDGHQADPASPWDGSALAAVEREETRAYVRQCIEELPETYRTIVKLRDIEEYDTQQTADLLGIEPGAVKVRLHRARQALRTLLDRRLRAGNSC